MIDILKTQIPLKHGASRSRWETIINCERVTLADALNKPKIDWVLPGLPAGSVGAIVGPGATGKSFLSIGIAGAVGCGLDILGDMFRCQTTGKVVVFFGEDPRSIVQERLHSFRQNLDSKSIELFDENVTIVSGHGMLCQLMDSNGEYGKFYNVFLEAARGARLLILDPFSRLHGGDENDNSAMTRMLQILESICKQTGATILIIHHTGKNATYNSGGEMSNQSASRGASSLSSGLRWQVNMWTPNIKEALGFGLNDVQRKFFVRMALVKANYTAPINDEWMQRGNDGVLQRVKLFNVKKYGAVKNKPVSAGDKKEEMHATDEASFYFPS